MADSGEITRQDVLPDDLIEAPLKMAKHFNILGVALDDVAAKAKKAGDAINASGSSSKIKKETEDLTLAEKELLKIQSQIAAVQAKNNDAYIEEAKTLAAAKQQLKEKIALGNADAKAVTAQNSAITKLEAALQANRKAYKELTSEEQRNSAEGKKLKAIIDEQDASVKKLNGGLGDFKDNVGNYKSGFAGIGESMQQIAPGATSAAQGIYGMLRAGLAFIATPIGLVIAAIGAALYALSAYFKSSEEGQNRLNKIMAVGSAIFEQFMNIVEDVGEAIFNAIENPQQAIKDFGKLVKDNIVNRFEGLLELFPALGKSISLLFKGEFAAAGKVALDAAVKVSLGIENVTDKISAAIEETKKLVDVGVQYGLKIAAIQAKLDKDERRLIVDRAKTNLEVAKLREAAVTLEGDAKKTALKEAIALEQELSNRELAFATLSLELAKTKLKANGDDKEALKEVAEAQAKVYDAQKLAFDNTLKFRKQLEALDQKEKLKDDLKERIAAAKLAAEQEYLIKKEQLDKNVALIKQEVIEGKKTKEQGEKEINALVKSQADEQVQLVIDKVNNILSIEGLSDEERLALDKELYKLRIDLANAFFDQVVDKEEETIIKLTKKQNETIGVLTTSYENFFTGITNLMAAQSDARIQKLDEQSKANEEALKRDLEAAGDNDAAKKAISEKAAAREAQLEKQRRAEKRKAAIQEQNVAVIEAGIRGALAVLNALATVEPYPLAVVAAVSAAALAGLQIAAIKAKPIPAYAVGTESAIGGPSLVGEKGTEMVVTPSGKLLFTPNRASIMDLEPKSKVYTHQETVQALALSALHTNDINGGSQDTNSIYGQETVKELKNVAEAVRKNKPQQVDYQQSHTSVYKAIKVSETYTKLIRESVLTGDKWS